MPGCWSEPTTKDAYRLSWASLVATALAAIGGIALYKSMQSSLALVFGLENCIDFISSAIVLWRFFAPSSLDDATEKKLKSREKRASVGISFTLIALGISICGTAYNDFKRGQEEIFDLLGAVIISLCSLPVFFVLTLLKFRYADQLSSASLYKDGICSLIGTCLAAAMFVNSLLISASEEAWWVDPFIAMIAGFCAIYIGAKAVYEAKFKESIPVFSLQWWMLSKGDGQDGMPEMTAHELELKEQNDNEGSPSKKSSTDEDDVEDVEII